MASFQVKSFVSIAASMINRMRAVTQAVTDYNVGSVVRTMLEAVAQEIDALYQAMLSGLLQAIPTATYVTFNFPANPAVAASGLIRVTITAQSAAVLIPAGTTFTPTSGSAVFASTADATISTGATYADVPVAATVAGASGNIAAGLSFVPSSQPAGFQTATNQVAFSNGIDAETADQHKLRFGAYVSSLARGTVSAIEYGASTAALYDAAGNLSEQVELVQVYEPYKTDNTQPTGNITIYVHNGTGSTSSALVTQCQQVIDGYYDANGNPVPGWKAAGVVATVQAATESAVNVTGTLTAAPGYDEAVLEPLVQDALSAYILGLTIAQSCIFAELETLAMNIKGVANFVLSAPTADVTASTGIKLMPGTFAITAG